MREFTGYREAVGRGTPEAVYEELHRGPVRDPALGVVIVGGYRAARQVLDTRNGDFRNAATLAPLYVPEPDVRRRLGEVFHSQGDARGMAFLDGEEHRRQRRQARSAFAAADRGRHLTALVDDALAALEGRTGPVDVVAGFIEPLARRSSLEERTGIPADLVGDLAVLLQGQIEMLWGLPGPEQQRKLVHELAQVWRICQEAVERNREDMRRGAHRHNIITGYLGLRPELAPADRLDIYGHVNAGYVSTVHTLGNVVVRTLADPGRWRKLHDNPDMLPGFVQRMLERHSGTHGWFKLCAAESGVEVDGEHVEPGTRLLVALNAANQAPDRGPDDPFLSFSFGPHTCLGKDFSLRLITTAVGALVARYPDARLAREPRPWANLAFNGFPEAEVVLSP
ncbi:cytochrome P450 [Saccharothrix syringae]|uniref:Cytochrome P450 n=1 Tax=Saccharothrix syringae TaxID=103733 RepID=A0A5Q0H636_SACSY|nr:cytochrome P450 [Saccharothrix syringae]QFZ21443.1 cytochrome P450 [Saccharothrix syringae]